MAHLYGTDLLKQIGAWGNGPPKSRHDRQYLVHDTMPTALRAYLTQGGALRAGASYSRRLLAWLEVVAG